MSETDYKHSKYNIAGNVKDFKYNIVADGKVIQTFDDKDEALSFFKKFNSYNSYKELKYIYIDTRTLEVVIC